MENLTSCPRSLADPRLIIAYIPLQSVDQLNIYSRSGKMSKNQEVDSIIQSLYIYRCQRSTNSYATISFSMVTESKQGDPQITHRPLDKQDKSTAFSCSSSTWACPAGQWEELCSAALFVFGTYNWIAHIIWESAMQAQLRLTIQYRTVVVWIEQRETKDTKNRTENTRGRI